MNEDSKDNLIEYSLTGFDENENRILQTVQMPKNSSNDQIPDHYKHILKNIKCDSYKKRKALFRRRK
jgi:hypothetical protein